MLRSVAEVSVLTGLSKVSIYNKLKLKEMEQFIVKSKGITYIKEEGIALIEHGLNLKEDLKEANDEVAVSLDDKEFKEFKVEFKELNKDYITTLKGENELLRKQLEEKDKQITELHKLIENSQVLLKAEQKKVDNQLYLSDHFDEVDSKLQDLKEKMEHRRNNKSNFFGQLLNRTKK